MASIKLHVYRGTNKGTESCDFRGDKFIGHEQGDEHRTVLEIDPASPDLIEEVLSLGPSINALLGRLTENQPAALGPIATGLGLEGDGPVGLRLGTWDN